MKRYVSIKTLEYSGPYQMGGFRYMDLLMRSPRGYYYGYLSFDNATNYMALYKLISWFFRDNLDSYITISYRSENRKQGLKPFECMEISRIYELVDEHLDFKLKDVVHLGKLCIPAFHNYKIKTDE